MFKFLALIGFKVVNFFQKLVRTTVALILYKLLNFSNSISEQFVVNIHVFIHFFGVQSLAYVTFNQVCNVSQVEVKIGRMGGNSFRVFFVNHYENVRIELLLDLISNPNECSLLDIEFFVLLIRFIDHIFVNTVVSSYIY